MRPIDLIPIITITCSLLLLSACGGGGGGDVTPTGDLTPTTQDNLIAVKLELVSTEPNAGHMVSLNSTIRANRDYQDLPVLYAMISKSDVDAGLEEVKVVFFGDDYVIPQVTAGEQVYNIKATIPVETREESEWYITPIIDPQETIEESDKEDNFLTEETVLLITISNANTGLPDVALVDVVYDDTMILYQDSDSTPPEILDFVDPETGELIEFTDSSDFDFNASLEMSTTGADPVTVGVYADLVVYQETLDEAGNVVDELEIYVWPLLVWDWGSFDLPADYSYYLEQEIFPGEPNFVELDFLIPGANHDDVEQFFGEDFGADGSIGPLNMRERLGLSVDAGLWTLEGRPLLGASGGFRRRWVAYVEIIVDSGSPTDGIELDEYESGFIDDGAIPEGLTAELDALAGDDSEIWLALNILPEDSPPPVFDVNGNPITVINPDEPLPPGACQDVEFSDQYNKNWGGQYFSLKLNARHDTKLTGAEGATFGFNASVPLTLFGSTINIAEFKTDASLRRTRDGAAGESFIQTVKALGVTLQTLPSMPSANVGLTFPAQMKTFEKSRIFYPAGIPVTLEGKATIALGLAGSGSLSPTNLSLAFGPYANIQGGAKFNANLTVASLGINGTLVLLDDKFQVGAGAQLEPPIPGASTLGGTLNASLKNKLTGPNGNLKLTAGLNSCAGLDTVGNTLADVGCSFIGLFGGCDDPPPRVRCPQTEVGSITLASFSSFERTDTIAEARKDTRICLQ
jgi:hypothetical protein